MKKKSSKRLPPKASKVVNAKPSKTQSQRMSVIASIGDGGNDKNLYKENS